MFFVFWCSIGIITTIYNTPIRYCVVRTHRISVPVIHTVQQFIYCVFSAWPMVLMLHNCVYKIILKTKKNFYFWLICFGFRYLFIQSKILFFFFGKCFKNQFLFSFFFYKIVFTHTLGEKCSLIMQKGLQNIRQYYIGHVLIQLWQNFSRLSVSPKLETNSSEF